MKVENLIKHRIQEELKNQLNLTNLHGVDVTKSLVEPYLDTFEDSFEEGKKIQLYVVLKEHPNSEEGYHIVCDPTTFEFGLTIEGNGKHRIFLGFDGTFIESFIGM
jgi:hypothetical protein